MDAIIHVFTSGNFSQMIVFLLGILTLSGFGIFLLIVAKKYGIKLNFFGKNGKDLIQYDDHPQDYKKMLQQSINIPTSQEYNQKNIIQHEVEKVQDFSNKKWESLLDEDNLLYNKDLTLSEKKDVIIEKLSKKNIELRQEIKILNEELKKYKLSDSPENIAFKSILSELENIYISEIKSLYLYDKIVEKINQTNIDEYSRSIVTKILQRLGSALQTIYDSTFLPSSDYFSNDFIKLHTVEFSSEFSYILVQMKEMQEEYKDNLLEQKKEIDKKIIKISNSYSLDIWTKLFNEKNIDELTLKNRREACKKNYSYFRDNVWNTTVLHRLIYGVGISMIQVFERAKSETLDKDIKLSLQFYQILKSEYEKEIKEFIIKKYVPNDSVKAVDINFKNQNSKISNESDLIEKHANDIFNIDDI